MRWQRKLRGRRLLLPHFLWIVPCTPSCELCFSAPPLPLRRLKSQSSTDVGIPFFPKSCDDQSNYCTSTALGTRDYTYYDCIAREFRARPPFTFLSLPRPSLNLLTLSPSMIPFPPNRGQRLSKQPVYVPLARLKNGFRSFCETLTFKTRLVPSPLLALLRPCRQQVRWYLYLPHVSRHRFCYVCSRLSRFGSLQARGLRV